MRRVVSFTLLCVLAPLPAHAQAFTTWLNARVDSVVAMKLSLRDPVKDVQVPARALGEENLVERAGIPDVAGIALHLPDQPSSSDEAAPAAFSLSATPYLLLGLFRGRPFDADYYLDHAWARRFGLSVTLDSDSAGRTTGEFQGKLVVLDRGTALDADRERRVSSALSRATGEFGELMETVLLALWERVGRQDEIELAAFVNALQQDAGLRNALARAGPETLAQVDSAIVQHIAAFVALRETVDSLAASTRARPQLAVGLSANTTGTAAQNVRAALIFDVGRPGYDVTLNAVYQYGAASDTAAERSTIEAAAQALLRLARPVTLQGRAPPAVALAGAVAYEIDGRGMIYRAQGKLLLPLAEGVTVPLSVTWASSTALIDEAEVRGHVGFTFDVARLIDSLR